MDEPQSRHNPLSALSRKRLTFHRGAILVALVVFLTLRFWGCGGQKSPSTTSSPASLALAVDDYSRYNNQTAACVKVVDGDTVDVNIPDLKAPRPQAYTRLRLWGIDTPEIEHHGRPAGYFGYPAAEFARKLMAGKKVRLELFENSTRDKFGRLLAYVFLPDGRMYNELALSEGYAYAEVRFKHPRYDEFLRLEVEARKNLRGLWPGITPDQLPHWYRPSRLKKFWESRGIETPPDKHRAKSRATASP